MYIDGEEGVQCLLDVRSLHRQHARLGLGVKIISASPSSMDKEVACRFKVVITTPNRASERVVYATNFTDANILRNCLDPQYQHLATIHTIVTCHKWCQLKDDGHPIVEAPPNYAESHKS